MKSYIKLLFGLLLSLTGLNGYAINDTSVCVNTGTAYQTLLPGINYQWSVTTGGTILSTFQNNATIYWSTSGSDTVSVIITDINGNNDTAQWIVTVHPGPDPFILTSFVSECADSLQGGTQGPDRKPCIGACDSTATKYYTPLTSGSTYSWKIDGGTIINGAGTNQITVVWGNTGQGSLVLIETNQWGCVDSVVECITINESPEAKFISPSNVCVNTGVSFLDQSAPAGDIVSWYWDFGDGNVSTAQNPVHAYSSGGTYTVTLVVMTACHCRDTATAVITVEPAQGPEIECPTPVCADSCATYSTPANCSSYLWTVTGGTLVSGQGTNTIEVCWGSGPVGTISLQVSGCSPNLCNIPTVVYIPILDDNLNINGPNPVCQFEIEKYCLPVYPGSIYNWSVNGGTILSGQNTQCIQVQWGAGPQGSVAVNVTNPLLGCQGSDSINVDILPEFFISTLNEEVCLDDTTMLFAWPGTGFTWYVTGGTIISGQGTSNVMVHWTSPGNQTVITVPAVSGTYCNDTVITNIKVRTIAPPDSIAGADSICPGKTYTYTAFSSIGGVVYEWKVQNGSPSSGSGNVINVTWDPNVPGPYCLSVRHRMVNTPNCPSDWVTMCVDTLPTPVVAISGGNGCVNQITSYTATVIPDADYSWSVTPSSMGSVVNGQGTPSVDIQWNSTAGTATIQLQVKSCNAVVNTALNVTLLPEPTVNPILSGPLCEGGSVTLNAGSWASYQWSTGATTNPITISSEGYYSVTVTDANGCTANSNVFVKEHPLPVASISSPDPLVHCIGSSYAVNLFALESSGYSYSWSNGSTTSSTVVSSPGTYCVTVSNSYGCTEVDCITVSEVTCSGGCPNCPPPCQTNGNINFTWNIFNNNCEQIEFINTSSGGSNFNWNFGDGNTLFQPTLIPSTVHTYAQAGFYLVSLTGQFIDNNGDTCILYIENSVEVHAVADFDYTIGCAGSSTVFTDLSTYTQGTTLSYFWDFGDGNNSTLPNPSNVYTSPGTYTVTLTVNAGGCMSTSIQTVTIPALPVANLSVPSPACAGQPVLFTDLSVPSANITDWEWSFGDGSQSTAQNPQHTYLTPGTYSVTLKVWDYAGCADDTTISISVIPAITDTISWSGSLIHCSDETDTLFAPAGLSYQWSNGATTQMIIVNQTGDYQVTVTGLNGCPYVAGPVKVEFLPPPVAIVNLNPGPVVCQGTLVTMCATQFQGYSYEWYNVTANISWGTGPCNYYFANSNATFLLIVTDQLGCKDTSAPVQIWVNLNPVVTISASGSTAFCKGGSVTLNANPSGGVIAYAWSNGSSSSSITVTSGGNYCVTVTDTNGCSSTACKQVTVWPLPDMSLVMTGCIELCLPDTIPGPPGYASYQWQLNGTNIPVSACGNCQNLPVTQPGNYTLILTTVNGCIDTSDILEVREDVCDTTLLDCFAANDPVFTKILSDVTYTNQYTVWSGHYYVGPNVTITVSGGTFDVTNVDIVFDTCSGIVFTDGAFLRANNSVFRPCNVTRSWRGFEFRRGATGIINECTFKNAQYATIFWGGANLNTHARITNNLFNNCKWGVTSAFNTFREAITGNTFVHDNTPVRFDDGPCIVYLPFNNTYYGIFSYISTFTGLISQNDFVNSSEVGTNKRLIGIYGFNTSAAITDNEFTNTYRAVEIALSKHVRIEHSEIEVTRDFSPFNFQISVASSGFVEILGNQIRNNNYYSGTSSLTNAAIYATRSSYLTLDMNEVTGFKVGIQLEEVNRSTVTNNHVESSKIYGIYMRNGQRNDIACNTVNMDLQAGGIVTGIAYFQTLPGNGYHRIRSNCIFETLNAILLNSTQNGNPIPDIRNNYLYNYIDYGIFNQNFSGNIGNNVNGFNDAGRNTFISNNIPQGAVDIFSTNPMIAAGNYGVSTVSNNVTIQGNGLYNSTASCGLQIGTVSSQIGNDEICDPNFSAAGRLLIHANNTVYLQPGYAEILKGLTEDERLDAATGVIYTLISTGQADEAEGFYQQVIQLLTGNQSQWLTYHYHLARGEYQAAGHILEAIIPATDEEARIKSTENVMLTVRKDGRSFNALNANEIRILNHLDTYYGQDDYAGITARYILHTLIGGHEHKYRAVLLPEYPDKQNENVIRLETPFIIAYPNPVKDELRLSWYLPGVQHAELQILDIRGKVVYRQPVTFEAGTMNLSVAQYPYGIYIAAIRTDEGYRLQRKLVVLK